MKLGATLAMCAASAFGTAMVLDSVTDGAIKRAIINKEFDLLDDPIEYAEEIELEEEHIVPLIRSDLPEGSPHDHVIMPIDDAVNIYTMLDDAIDKIDPEEHSGTKCFGDRAVSITRLFEAIEQDLDAFYDTTPSDDESTTETVETNDAEI